MVIMWGLDSRRLPFSASALVCPLKFLCALSCTHDGNGIF